MGESDRFLAGVGDNVRVAREHLGMSQKQLAAACGIGQSAVSDIEGGLRDFRILTLRKIASGLASDLDALLKITPK